MTKKQLITILSQDPDMGYPGIYGIREKATNRWYIGQTRINLLHRIIQHINAEKVDGEEKEAKNIDKALKRKGIDAFEFVAILPMFEPTVEELNFQEVRYIGKYDSKEHGYNLTVGNHAGKHTPEDFRTTHEVPKELTRFITSNYTLDFTDKRVLLIGSFNSAFQGLIDHEAKECIVINKFYHSDSKEEKLMFLEEYTRIMSEIHNKFDIVVGEQTPSNKFDIIISNPPYGVVGREITNNIINTIKFDVFLNIMPLAQYGPNKLYEYIDITSIKTFGKDAFKDADRVFATICKINHYRTYYENEIEFRVKTANPKMLRYHMKNIKATELTAFDVTVGGKQDTPIDIDKTFMLYFRTGGSNILWSQYNSSHTRWNLLRNITPDEFIHTNKQGYNITNNQLPQYTIINFKTTQERDNFTDFMYSVEGRQFIMYIYGPNAYEYNNPGVYLPKLVNWKKPQTIESILKAYKYSPDEIKEISAEIRNIEVERCEWDA